jgi:hypothetical protein
MASRQARTAQVRLVRVQATVVAVAVLIAAVGVGVLALMLRERTIAPAEEVTLGGLSLRVVRASWEQGEDEGQPAQGFQMPPQMMPGAPAPGDQRLKMDVALANRSRNPKTLDAEEFRIQIPGGASWPVKVDSIGTKLLNPGLGLDGALHFDLPLSKIPKGIQALNLLWERGGHGVRIAVPVGDAPPSGGHH